MALLSRTICLARRALCSGPSFSTRMWKFTRKGSAPAAFCGKRRKTEPPWSPQELRNLPGIATTAITFLALCWKAEPDGGVFAIRAARMRLTFTVARLLRTLAVAKEPTEEPGAEAAVA